MKALRTPESLAYCIGGLLLATLFWTSADQLWAEGTKDGIQAEAVVTVMAKHGKESRPVPREAVTVDRNGGEVDSWTSLTGKRAGLQLLILLDDSSSTRIDTQLSDIRRFVLALPPTTEIAIGYMQNGHAQMTQNFTTDHAAAAKTVRSTMGVRGGNGSPYFTLQDVIKRWPAENSSASGTASITAPRREILMVTDGVDRYTGARFDPENQYVLNAIQDAQRAGVLIHSIYYRGAGAFDSNQEVTLGGQSYLEQVAHATGGKCYTEGLENPVSFRPFLDELSERLQSQYELRFISAERVDRGLVPLKLKIQAPGVSVDAPDMARVATAVASGGMK